MMENFNRWDFPLLRFQIVQLKNEKKKKLTEHLEDFANERLQQKYNKFKKQIVRKSMWPTMFSAAGIPGLGTISLIKVVQTIQNCRNAYSLLGIQCTKEIHEIL
jgi:hypothetical protein